MIPAEDLKQLQAALPEAKIEYIEAKPEHVKQMQDAQARAAKGRRVLDVKLQDDE